MEYVKTFLSTLETMELPKIGASDIVEIVILAVVVYYLLCWVQNTRTWFVLRGVVVLLVLFALATVLQLNTILFLARNAVSLIFLALIVVFQPELRKALERIGQRNVIFRFLGNSSEEENRFNQTTIDELVKAAFELGRTRTGALIVIERELPLTEYIQTGIAVDAVVTSPLLINIFEHNTPLHDGAVVIRGNRVASATCYLPLSQNPNISKELGTRHRAAVGVSEVTDSLTIVVSEETGKVSVAEKGEISRNLTSAELQAKLQELHAPAADTKGFSFRFWRGRQKDEKADSE